MSPSPSSSMPFWQSSTGGFGFDVQFGIGVDAQVPFVQTSVVQASWSLQSASVVHCWGGCAQEGFTSSAHAPAVQTSVVQASPSSGQSASTTQGVQLGIAVAVQTPFVHASVVQASLSLQSASVPQTVHDGTAADAQAPALHVSVVQGLPSSGQSVSAMQGVQLGSAVDVHAPATQASVVQTFESSQSASLVQAAQPAGARFTVSVASSWTCGALVANAVATFTYVGSLQVGEAFAESVT